jgi:hypothetical protein
MMFRRTCISGLTALLGACASAPLSQDQSVSLWPDQGLAAVMIDTLDPISQVSFQQQDGGAKLLVAAVSPGIGLYLFPTRAGRYCMTRFHYANFDFAAEKGAQQCFQVTAGKLSYSGTLAPRVEDGKPVTRQVQDPQGFRVLLEQDYPTVAKQFPAPQP